MTISSVTRLPDEVIVEETWELGEHFRSGMVWHIGKGKVF